MSLLDDVILKNEHFVEDYHRQISRTPAKRIAIFTCMDTRLVDFLEPAMGLRRGDAMVIKNAGNSLLDPSGSAVRSLVVAVFALGCEEIFVIGHLDCGMADIEEEQLRRHMLDRGVPHEAITAMKPSMRAWLGAFHDPHGNVLHVVDMIHQSKLIPKDVPVHGLMFDPHSGRLELLLNGNADVTLEQNNSTQG